jgi:hypothetical protein
MRSTFDIVDILYSVLSNEIGITSVINGSVYKNMRPLGSIAEDIVIGSLPVNFEQIQQAVANINIHVPNLVIKVGTTQDNTQPNNKRLKQLTNLVLGIVKEGIGSDYWFELQQQNTFSEDQEHYSNIRLNFYSENI